MPTISATVVRKPRRVRYCSGICGRRIEGTHLRLYGSAHSGDPKYSVRICLECASVSGDAKTKAAAARKAGEGEG